VQERLHVVTQIYKERERERERVLEG